jgi:hypothetical protein
MKITTMKRILNTILSTVIMTVSGLTVASAQSGNQLLSNGSGNSVMVINAFDSVFFDVFQASVVGNQVEVPVYFRSDDIINAVDFEFKYDQTKLEYDTIVFAASYIEGLSFYNQNDSVVRLTSYSFTQPYTNDSVLFKIKFTLLSGTQICAGDLNSVGALLNGDACTAFVTDCLTGISESESFTQVELYPNPVQDQLSIQVQEISEVNIFDIHGNLVQSARLNGSNEATRISVAGLAAGSYVVRLAGKKTNAVGRFVKIR